MRRLGVARAGLIVLAIGALLSLISFAQVSSQQARPSPNRILEYNAAVVTGRIAAAPKRQFVSGGVLATYLDSTRAVGGAGVSSQPYSGSVPRRTLGCSNSFSGQFRNVRVNQDCSFRRQAEEFIAINPTDPDNLVAGQNDSVIGFNHCGIDFSFDRGRTWGTMTPPFWQFIGAGGTTFDAASDPAVTFDSQGNAYFACVVFNIFTAQSALLVTKSNAANGGAFFHTPAPLAFQEFRANPPGVVANDNNPAIFHDKEFINADRSPTSPKRDRIYVTWTRFQALAAFPGQRSPIFFSQSTNGGATWSAGIEISGSASVCTDFSGTPSDPNRCDQDQGSYPAVGPDGTIYVVFGNGNTPLVGINQILVTKCPAAANCALASSWTAPVKVADLIGTHPLGPDPATGCPVQFQCLPPNGYRVPEFASMTISADPTSSSRLFVTWSDSRNIGPSCDFDGGTPGSAATATPPCNNDVFLSISNNGGSTWGGPILVTGNGGQTAQWQPWSDVAPDGTLFIAYYDRRFGNCEFTGCNDITLAVRKPSTGTFKFFRLTTASMPNLIPANNPLQAGFLGDYMGIAADRKGAVIVWGDTRGRNGTVEEDIRFVNFRGEDDN